MGAAQGSGRNIKPRFTELEQAPAEEEEVKGRAIFELAAVRKFWCTSADEGVSLEAFRLVGWHSQGQVKMWNSKETKTKKSGNKLRAFLDHSRLFRAWMLRIQVHG